MLIEPHHEKTCYAIHKQQRRRSACASAQSDHAFVLHCLDSIIPLVSISKISSFYLASVAAQASVSLTWSKIRKTGFLVSISSHLTCPTGCAGYFHISAGLYYCEIFAGAKQ